MSVLEKTKEVTAHWIKQQMETRKLKTKDLVAFLDIDKSTLSSILNENVSLTKWHKAAFYYFFKSFEK